MLSLCSAAPTKSPLCYAGRCYVTLLLGYMSKGLHISDTLLCSKHHHQAFCKATAGLWYLFMDADARGVAVSVASAVLASVGFLLVSKHVD